MSTYSQYGTGLFEGSEIVANEAYDGAVGGYRAIEENSINMHSIFESVIGRDFAEAYTEMGVLDESTFESLNEASGSGVWAKVAAFFRKITEKILGILKNFRDRIVMTFTRDGKELVRKYDKQILKKMNTNVLDDKFTYKWCKWNGALIKEKGLLSKAITEEIMDSEVGKQLDTCLKNAQTLKDSKMKGMDKAYADLDQNTKKDIDDIVYDYDQLEEWEDKVYSALLDKTTTTKKDFLKDFMEEVFDDEDTEEGLDNTRYSEIKECLKEGGKILNSLSKEESSCKKEFKKIIKEAENIQKELDKLAGKSDPTYKRSSATANKWATNTIKLGNICSAAAVAGVNAYGTAVKKYMKQCRSVFVKAATFGGKKESSTLMEAVGQVSDFEVDQMFE